MNHWSSSLPFISPARHVLCWIVGLGLLSSSIPGHADIKLPTGGGVRVFPAKVQVESGGTVTIPLTGSVSSKSRIQFFIRQSPKQGRLGEIQQVNSERAEVVYTHDGKSTSDRFRYSGKVAGLPVSPSSPVIIEVIPPEATTFPIPEFIDFGTHFAGDVWVESFTLTSSQAEPVTLEIDAPWQVDGATSFTLQPGKPVNVSLLFVPNEQRKYLGYLRFPGTTFPVVRLHGEALAPLVLSSETLTIPADPERVVEDLLIANISGSDREIVIESSENLEAPPLLPVPADGEHAIPFRYTGPPAQASQESLTIRMGAWSASIEVTVEPGPAAWEWLGERQQDLGELISDDAVPLQFQLQNKGGKAGTLALATSHPALIVKSSRAVVLPGETHTVEAHLHPPKLMAGPFQIRLEAKSQEEPAETLVPFLIQGTKPAPAEAAKPPVAFPASTPVFTREDHASKALANDPQRSDQKVERQGGILRREPIDFDAELPVIDEIVSRRFLDGNRDYQLVWNAPDGGPFSYAVDVQYLRKNVLTWWPIRDLKFRHEGKTVSTTLRELAPGHSYLFRIRTITGDGRSSAPSPVIEVHTPIAPSFPWRWTFVILILLSFGIFGFWRWRQNQPQEPERRPAMF